MIHTLTVRPQDMGPEIQWVMGCDTCTELIGISPNLDVLYAALTVHLLQPR